MWGVELKERGHEALDNQQDRVGDDGQCVHSACTYVGTVNGAASQNAQAATRSQSVGLRVMETDI